MAKQIVVPPHMAPTSGYSYAVKKSGTPLFIAGQVALDASGKIVGEGDAAAQAEQAFQNLRSVVVAAGGSMDDVVKINVYVTDAKYRPAIAAARERHFKPGSFPASTYVVVSGLAVPQLLVEVEAVAMIE
ncbi:MAG TPA: RidA family protein [Myxococcota bacterium]|jgi:enamine deaminase RidA (YjgF/YER057c/UK114 family)|nr:RidA family protein [Myxococcota bacterium]